MLIRPETAADHAAIRALNQAAFGGAAEGKLVDELRACGAARISLVAEDDGWIIGHILFSALSIHTSEGALDSLALAPLSVVPDRQRQGIGAALIREGLRRAKQEGCRSVVVLGHADYYPRFGFSAELARPLTCAWSGPHLMALELVPQALHGVRGELKYAPPFESL